MRVVACLLLLLAGCFSWTQTDAPPRETWNDPIARTCDGYGSAAAAAVTSGLMIGVSALIAATTERGNLNDFEERAWLVFTVPLAIGYGLDTMNAASDANECKQYREHVAKRRGLPAPPPPYPTRSASR